MLHKLHYISQGDSKPKSHLINIQSVLDAGVLLVQLRIKNISLEEYTDIACQTKELCTQYQANLVINDNAHVALKSKANVLHLGLEDISVIEARKIVPEIMIGGTANTFEHVQQRCTEMVNYIGLGPYRFTKTKEKLSPILGVEGYQTIIKKMKEHNLNTPVYAIGGIEFNDIEPLIDTGVYGIAISGLLTNSDRKEKLVKEICKILYHA